MKTIISLAAVALLVSGCANYTTKGEFAPNVYDERPKAILVLPPINNSTAADAKEYYITTIAEPLSNSGAVEAVPVAFAE